MAIFTQTAIGAGMLTVIIQTIWAVIGPEPPPILVHQISYADGMITSDRTITTNNPFRAVREVAIVDEATGLAIPGCEGTTVWDYSPGRLAPTFTLQEWVGSDNCRLGPGSYVPSVTYSAGEFMLSVRGDPFVIMDEVGK